MRTAIIVLVLSAQVGFCGEEERKEAVSKAAKDYAEVKTVMELEIERLRVIVEKGKNDPKAKNVASAKAEIAKLEGGIELMAKTPLAVLKVKAVEIGELWATDVRGVPAYEDDCIVLLSCKATVEKLGAKSTDFTTVSRLGDREFVVDVKIEEPTKAKVGESVSVLGWFEIVSRSQGVRKSITIRRIEWTAKELKRITGG